MNEYFAFVSRDVWIQTLIVAAAVVMTAAAGAVHWPTRFSGPLSRKERRPQRHRRLGIAATLTVAGLAVLAAVQLVAPLRRGVDVLLVSQTRLDVPPKAQTSLRAGLAEARRPALDLGPTVDALLASCEICPEMQTGSAPEIDALRRAIAPRLRELDFEAAEPSGPKRASRRPDVAPWVIESVELTVLHAAVLRLNVRRAFVVPSAEARHAEAWVLTREMLEQAGVEVRWLGATAGWSDVPGVIRHIAQARAGSAGLSLWAVVGGPHAGGAFDASLLVVGHDGATVGRARARADLPALARGERVLVELKGPAPDVAQGSLRISSADRAAWAPLLVGTQSWRGRLASAPSLAPALDRMRSHLGADFPERGGDTPDGFVDARCGALAIARRPELVARALDRACGHPPRPRGVVRVYSHGDTTVDSWHLVALPSGTPSTARLTAPGMTPLASTAPTAAGGEPVVAEAMIDGERALLMDLRGSLESLLPGGARYSPSLFRAVARSMQTGVRMTHKPVRARTTLEAVLPRPVIRGVELQEDLRRSRRPLDASLLALVALYLALVMAHARRSKKSAPHAT